MIIQLGYVKFRNDGKVDQMKKILTFSSDLRKQRKRKRKQMKI